MLMLATVGLACHLWQGRFPCTASSRLSVTFFRDSSDMVGFEVADWRGLHDLSVSMYTRYMIGVLVE